MYVCRILYGFFPFLNVVHGDGIVCDKRKHITHTGSPCSFGGCAGNMEATFVFTFPSFEFCL